MMRFFGRGDSTESPTAASPTAASPPTPLPAAPVNFSTGPAKPIRLVYTDEKGHFCMDPEAVALLQLVKEPVGVVSVCGRARQGKSFILNQLLGKSSGFQVASTHRPCTKGLWLWSAPIKRTALDGTEYNLLLLDSEGIDAYDQTGTYSTQIFSLAVLLSSMFIYNQMGGIDEAALDRLSLVTEMTKHIRVRANGGRSSASELGQFSPIFVWLLRDFYLDLAEDNRKITPRDYLELALRPVHGGGRDVAAKNEIRESIRALFPDRECFTLVRPVNSEVNLQRLDQIPLDKLRPEFRSGLDSFTRFVFERTRPKQMGATVMTGPILARITQSFLDALNNGAVPTITSSWQSVEEAECQRAYELATEVYMSTFDRSKPPEEASLREEHDYAVRKSMATFNDTAVGAGLTRFKYEKRLQTFLKKAFEDFKKDCFREAYLKCTSTIEDMRKELRVACHAPDASINTIVKVLDGLLSKYDATCHGPEKWQKAVQFMQQSLVEGPILDFIKRQMDQIATEKSSLALKCRSIEDKMGLLNKQLEASEKYKSEYLKRYEDATNDKKKFADEYTSRITNLQAKCSSLEEKSSNLSKALETARQESLDWKRKYELVLSRQKAEEEQSNAEVAMLRSRSSAAEARLAATQEKAQSAKEEAEEWKRKYDVAVREAKSALEKAAAIQERTSYQSQSKEAALRTEFSSTLAEKEEEIKEKAIKLEQVEKRLTTLGLELKAAESKIKSYELETSNLKLQLKEFSEKVESTYASSISAENKARILEQEKLHLEQKYQGQFDRFEELQERCKAAEKDAKRATELADEARAEAASALKERSVFERLAMERLAQIERAQRQAESLETQRASLFNEVQRCREAESVALEKIQTLEKRVSEKQNEVDSLLQSHNSQREDTVQILETLLKTEREAHAQANSRADSLSVKLQETQVRLNELSHELNSHRFGDKSGPRTGSHAKRVRTDDIEMVTEMVEDSVQDTGTDSKLTRSRKRSKNFPSSPKAPNLEDGGSFSGNHGQTDVQSNIEDYTKLTIPQLKQLLTAHGVEEVWQKNASKRDLVDLCEKRIKKS